MEFKLSWGCQGCDTDLSTVEGAGDGYANVYGTRLDEIVNVTSIVGETEITGEELLVNVDSTFVFNSLGWDGNQLMTTALCEDPQVDNPLFSDGNIYTFSVSVKFWDSGVYVGEEVRSIAISANRPPYGGDCTITPANGTALSTNFSIVCPPNGWNDLDVGNSEQLSYIFANNGVFLSNSYQPLGTSVGPFVLGAKYHKLLAIVIDNYGYARCQNVYSHVTIDTSEFLNTDDAANFISNYLDSLDLTGSSGNNSNVTIDPTVLLNNLQNAVDTLKAITGSLSANGTSSNNSTNGSSALGKLATDMVKTTLFIKNPDVTEATQIVNVIGEVASLSDDMSSEEMAENYGTDYTETIVEGLDTLIGSSFADAFISSGEPMSTQTAEVLVGAIGSVMGVLKAQGGEKGIPVSPVSGQVTNMVNDVMQLVLGASKPGESFVFETNGMTIGAKKFDPVTSNLSEACEPTVSEIVLSSEFVERIDSTYLDCVNTVIEGNIMEPNVKSNEWPSDYLNVDVSIPLSESKGLTSRRRRLQGASDQNDTYLSACQPILLKIPNTGAVNWSLPINPDEEVTPLEEGEAESVTFPSCKYWNETTRQFEGDGCYVLGKNENYTICACRHTTFFGMQKSDVSIEISMNTVTDLSVFTWDNITKHPTGIASVSAVIGLFIILVVVSPKKQDKPLIAHEKSIYKEFREETKMESYRVIQDRRILEDKEMSLLQKAVPLWLHVVRNEHEVFSIFFRHRGTGYSSRQRASTLIMKFFTVMAVNGMFYGNKQPSAFGDMLVSILGTILGLPPTILKLLFLKYRPREREYEDHKRNKKMLQALELAQVSSNQPSLTNKDGRQRISSVDIHRQSTIDEEKEEEEPSVFLDDDMFNEALGVMTDEMAGIKEDSMHSLDVEGILGGSESDSETSSSEDDEESEESEDSMGDVMDLLDDIEISLEEEKEPSDLLTKKESIINESAINDVMAAMFEDSMVENEEEGEINEMGIKILFEGEEEGVDKEGVLPETTKGGEDGEDDLPDSVVSNLDIGELHKSLAQGAWHFEEDDEDDEDEEEEDGEELFETGGVTPGGETNDENEETKGKKKKKKKKKGKKKKKKKKKKGKKAEKKAREKKKKAALRKAELNLKQRTKVLEHLRKKILTEQRKLGSWARDVGWAVMIIWSLGCAFLVLYYALRFDELFGGENNYSGDVTSECDSPIDVGEESWLLFNRTQGELDAWFAASDPALFEPNENDSFGGDDMSASVRWFLSVLVSFLISIFAIAPITMFIMQLIRVLKFDPKEINEEFFFAMEAHLMQSIEEIRAEHRKLELMPSSGNLSDNPSAGNETPGEGTKGKMTLLPTESVGFETVGDESTMGEFERMKSGSAGTSSEGSSKGGIELVEIKE